MKAKDATSYRGPLSYHSAPGVHVPYLSQNFAFCGGKLLSVAVRCDRQKRTHAFP